MKSNSPDLEAHDEVLEAIRQYDPLTVADGPVVPARYATARPRLLWVLREANGEGPWDLREFLGDDTRLRSYPRWHITYGAVAKISHGLIKGLAAEDVRRLRAQAVVDALRDVAVINVNKRGGEGRIAWGKLVANAQAFTSFVERQVTVLAPEIIIAAGTASLLPDSLCKYSTSLEGRCIGAVRLHENRLLVKCYHTGQTRIPHDVLYTRILGALRDVGWIMRGSG